MKCPKCGYPLTKETVCVITDIDMAKGGKITARRIVCVICGNVIKEKKFNGKEGRDRECR